jgi:hypothetical protein
MMVLDIVSWHGLLHTEVQVGRSSVGKYAKTSQGELHRAEGWGISRSHSQYIIQTLEMSRSSCVFAFKLT